MKVIESVSDINLKLVENKLLKNRKLLKISELNYDKISKMSYYVGLNHILRGVYLFKTVYAHNNNYQCGEQRNRSQSDLYMIMKYYYPNITFKEFRKVLFRLCTNSKASSFICNTINKRVFFKGTPTLDKDEDCFIYNCDLNDEFGWIVDFNVDEMVNTFYSDTEWYY